MERLLKNSLFAALPKASRERLFAKTQQVSLSVNDILHQTGEAITAVYFPLTCVISMMTEMRNGATIEIATVGNEGMIGIPAYLGVDLSIARGITQVSGEALRMRVEDFNRAVRSDDDFDTILGRYTHALLMQLARSRYLLLAVLALVPSPVRAADPPPIEVEVDLTAVARRVVHTKLTIPANPGPLTLYYPKWIPGTHSPVGPVADQAGLRITAGSAVLLCDVGAGRFEASVVQRTGTGFELVSTVDSTAAAGLAVDAALAEHLATVTASLTEPAAATVPDRRQTTLGAAHAAVQALAHAPAVSVSSRPCWWPALSV